MSDEEGESSNENEDKSDFSEEEESKATLLVNSVICKNISPANIRKLIFVPEKKKPSNETKKIKNLNK